MKIRRLTEMERDIFKISDYIDDAKFQNKTSIIILGDVHPRVLERLVSEKKITWKKRRILFIFEKRTIISWKNI